MSWSEFSGGGTRSEHPGSAQDLAPHRRRRPVGRPAAQLHARSAVLPIRRPKLVRVSDRLHRRPHTLPDRERPAARRPRLPRPPASSATNDDGISSPPPQIGPPPQSESLELGPDDPGPATGSPTFASTGCLNRISTEAGNWPTSPPSHKQRLVGRRPEVPSSPPDHPGNLALMQRSSNSRSAWPRVDSAPNRRGPDFGKRRVASAEGLAADLTTASRSAWSDAEAISSTGAASAADQQPSPTRDCRVISSGRRCRSHRPPGGPRCELLSTLGSAL